MSKFLSALHRSCKSVMASATVLALTPLAITVPGILHADDFHLEKGNGNAHGKNKDYPYGVNQRSKHPYAIGVWGDLPYSAEQAAVIPNLLADMNSQELAFTAHDGDLRQGSGSPDCADSSIYTRATGYFASLYAPAIFTPGDNDWTDCDRKTCKGFGSANDNVGPGSNVSLPQTATYTDVPCVENRRWIVGSVMYATLNIQGSCNNLCDDYPDPVEYAARNAANIQWMNDTFATAVAQNCVAVMFITQADPGWDDTDGTRAPTRNANTLVEDDAQKTTDGYHDFLVALRKQVIAFGKPVAYVNGDSHYFRVDKPLLDSAGSRVINFTRVETFGDHQPTRGDANWLKVNVDPSSRESLRTSRRL
jgi:hypothetical protein